MYYCPSELEDYRGTHDKGASFLLSERQCEVLTLAARGLSNMDIAERLDVSYYTVRAHIRDIRDVLGAKNTTEAVAKGIADGVISYE